MDASTRVHQWKRAAAITLARGDLQATFLPEIGMLGASLRHAGDELLVLPKGLAGYRAGHQAGLPLLAPWANRLGQRRYEVAGRTVDLSRLDLHTDDNGLPIHGTMTARPGWEIVRVGRGSLSVRFDYGTDPELLAAFPFPHELVIDASVDGESLSVATTLRPTTDVAVPACFGWHPYLRIPRVPRRSWRLVLPPRDHVELDDRGLPTGRSTAEPPEGLAIGDRAFDDLYELAGHAELAVEGGGRRVTMRCLEGYRFAQVFVPPGRPFACLEAMVARTNALVTGGCPLIQPGDAHVARFAIAPTFLG